MWCNKYGTAKIAFKRDAFGSRVVSFNGSRWHGDWHYEWNGVAELGAWIIEFHYNGDDTKAKKCTMKQMKGTTSFSDGNGCVMVPVEA